VAWPQVVLGQVLKIKQKGRGIGVLRSVLEGSLAQVLALLPSGRGLNAVYIERLNATFGARLAALVRRGGSLVRQKETLHWAMYLVGTVSLPTRVCPVGLRLRQRV
jgi:hypothetical protein